MQCNQTSESERPRQNMVYHLSLIGILFILFHATHAVICNDDETVYECYDDKIKTLIIACCIIALLLVISALLLSLIALKITHDLPINHAVSYSEDNDRLGEIYQNEGLEIASKWPTTERSCNGESSSVKNVQISNPNYESCDFLATSQSPNDIYTALSNLPQDEESYYQSLKVNTDNTSVKMRALPVNNENE